MKMKVKFSLLFCSILLISVFVRIYHLTSVPPALHGDELGVGYNAYTLLKSGRDEYGRFLPLTFRSDFTPLIFYATVPFIALFGLTEFATRFPTALIGLFTVPGVYFLVYELTGKKKLALLTMCLVGLSSWHIRTSRIALELTWALFFQIVAVTLFLRSLRFGRSNLIISFFFFGISIFSYHSTKMTTPMLLISLLVIYKQQVKKIVSLKILILLFCLSIILPIILYVKVQAFSQIRFVGISVFTLWKNSYPAGTNLFSVKPLSELGITILKNYLVHFNPHLLFVDNSNLRYFQLPQLGLFYVWQTPFILVGFFTLIRTARKNKPWVIFVLFWLLLSPLPAAITTGVPYANIGRVLMMLPIVELFSAIGVLYLFKSLKAQKNIFKNLLISLFLGIIIYNTIFFLRGYFEVMPKKFSNFWGVHYRLAARTVLEYENSTDKIIFTNPIQQSYIYILFYGHKNPDWLFSQYRLKSPVIGYRVLANYEFRSINWNEDQYLTNALLIGTVDEIPMYPNVVSQAYMLKQTGDLKIIKTK